MISTSYAFASYLIPSLWLKNKSNQNDAFIEILLVFRSVLQSFKRQNSVREFFFISSCSPIWPRKRPLISISFSFICPWHGFRSCSLCAFRRLEKKANLDSTTITSIIKSCSERCNKRAGSPSREQGGEAAAAKNVRIASDVTLYGWNPFQILLSQAIF